MTDHERPSDATDDGPEIRKTGRQSPMDLGEARGGAMTGETGSLTGMDTDEAFIPGELREINDPMHSGSLTEQSADASDAHRKEVRDEGRDAPD